MMEEALSAISQVGFPIVAFLLMYYQSTKVIRENTKAIRDLQADLKRRNGD